jgi:hypothetical protein
MAPMVLKFFCCPVMEKIEDKLVVKILPVTLFKMLVAAFRKPLVIV